MAWAFVQFAENSASASGGAITATFGGNTTAGNSILCVICCNSDTVGVTSVDHNSQGLTQRDIITNATDVWQMRWFTIDNITGGATTVTYTPASSVAFRGIAVVEVSGLRTTGSYARGSWNRQSPSVNGTDGTVSGTVDTTSDGMPVLQAALSFDFNAALLPSAGTGFTSRGTGWANFGATAMRWEDRNRTTGSAAEQALFTCLATTGLTYTGQLILLEPSTTPSVTLVSPRIFALGSSVTVLGSSFEAAQGAGSVRVCPTDNIADSPVTQTVTAWGDTSVTITSVLGALTAGTTCYLFVTNNTGNTNASGYPVHFLVTPPLAWTSA
jgi:3D (Asp-Asp-Asp) domain-containing protein